MLRLVEVFREVRRTLTDDGTLWLNIGDSYSNAGGKAQPHRNNHGGFGGSDGKRTQDYAKASGGFVRTQLLGGHIKPKDLIGIPWLLAFALRADGWYLRQDIIWSKPNPMPESVTDRCGKAHEYLFLLSKSEHYYFDYEAIKEPAVSVGRAPGGNRKLDASRCDHGRDMTIPTGETRRRRSVWTIAPKPFKGAHFAVYPPELIEPCVLAGCIEGGLVLDPFGGSGTTGGIALKHGRNAILCELNADYAALMPARIESIG